MQYCRAAGIPAVLFLYGRKIMTKFRNNIAGKCGVNAAVIAEYLWYLQLNEASGDPKSFHHGSAWCRCSVRMMTAEFPFLSLHMAKNAVYELREKGFIRKGCFNDDRFDHTNEYRRRRSGSGRPHVTGRK